MASATLSKARRADSLERMATERFDIAVIGGGVTGAGIALDAATRGLSVALVEQRDFAAGTSSRSSKLIHGGIRYLEQGNLALVREALSEQTLMLDRLCPHLVRPVPFLFPLERRIWQRLYVGTGMLLYDLLAGKRAVPRHRHYSRQGALRRFPALRHHKIVGAIEYFDAEVDDARHTLALARTAGLYGARLATSARAIDLLDRGQGVCGVRVRDLESGKEFDLRARQVINATGVWTDQVQSMAGRGWIHVRASKGIHLVVPRDRIHAEGGLILRTRASVLFVIPWKEHWIIGTTDSDWNLDLAHPAASAKDIDYLLDTVNRVLDPPLKRSDIQGVYAGLRPLLSGESEATSQLSREHAVSRAASGLISVAGGKYTTYRIMARDAVDMAVRDLPRRVPESCTHEIPLIGAVGHRALAHRREELADRFGLDIRHVDHLLERHGSYTSEVLAQLDEHPEWAAPIPGAEEYLLVEAAYAGSHEGAMHLDDVLTRRTRISIEVFDRGLRAAVAVAEVLRPILGWDSESVKRELAHYEARVAAERESQEQPDDQTADAARLGAPDVRVGAAGPPPSAGSLIHTA